MLHWLAGQKQQDADTAPDELEREDGPETPAPVFAVRAFKHAIFGTPATQAKPRRNSNNETSRPRQHGRPGLPRPKSANDTHTMGKLEDNAVPCSPLPSPTKGILMTPGTATTRRKTVSFGLSVVDNEQKRPMKSGLPDDCPGKFPSPWSQSTLELDNSDEPSEKLRGRTKLIEQFEQVREELAKMKSRSNRQPKDLDVQDSAIDYTQPASDSGRYWKQEYDIYRENTTMEVKKLVEKQRSAKRYAKEKDAECQATKEELRREKKRADRLEKRTAELEAQLRELQAKIQRDQRREIHATADAVTDNGASYALAQQPSKDEHAEVSQLNSWREPLIRLSRRDANALGTARRPEPFDDNEARACDAPQGTRPRPRRIQTDLREDLRPVNLDPPTRLEANPPSPRTSRTVTSGTDATPLQSLSVNTLAQQEEDSRAIAMSMGLQPPSPQRHGRQDSPMQASGLPISDPESPSRSAARPAYRARRDSKPEVSVPGKSPASPVQTNALALERPNVLTGQPVPVRTSFQPSSKVPDVKENISPVSRGQQPSAAWTAMSNAAIERRVVSKGKEIEADRLAKAKARLQERGRQVS